MTCSHQQRRSTWDDLSHCLWAEPPKIKGWKATATAKQSWNTATHVWESKHWSSMIKPKMDTAKWCICRNAFPVTLRRNENLENLNCLNSAFHRIWLLFPPKKEIQCFHIFPKTWRRILLWLCFSKSQLPPAATPFFREARARTSTTKVQERGGGDSTPKRIGSLWSAISALESDPSYQLPVMFLVSHQLNMATRLVQWNNFDAWVLGEPSRGTSPDENTAAVHSAISGNESEPFNGEILSPNHSQPFPKPKIESHPSWHPKSVQDSNHTLTHSLFVASTIWLFVT